MKWKTKDTDILFDAILLLESMKDAENFFRDLLTEQEITEFANRFKAASLLDGGASYLEVQKATGMSSTTVARIAKSLNKGMNGYKTQLSKMHHHAETSSKKRSA